MNICSVLSTLYPENINKEIITVTGSSLIEQLTEIIPVMESSYFLLGSCLEKNCGHICKHVDFFAPLFSRFLLLNISWYNPMAKSTRTDYPMDVFRLNEKVMAEHMLNCWST